MKCSRSTVVFYTATLTLFTLFSFSGVVAQSPSPSPTGTPEECPQDQIVTFAFDVDSDSNPLPAGTVMSNQYAGDFLTLSADSATDTVIIFDSANPTGGDFDLGTPNETFPSGVGIGTGGESGQPGANSVAQGKILIIAENITDSVNNTTTVAPPDGLVDVPDDDADGGKILFDFDYPVRVLGIDFLDVELPGSGEDVEITGRDSGSITVFTANASNLGDNSFQPVNLNSLQSGFPTSQLEVNFISTSGAIGAVQVCEQKRDCLDIPGGDSVDLGCGCDLPGPGPCGCTDQVDLGCGCGEPAPGPCGCTDQIDLGCGCGEPAPGPCGCNEEIDLGCGCGNPAPGACGCEPCFCGNGTVENDEQCDDGNDVDSDGCNNNCEPSGFEVVANPLCENDAPYVEYQVVPFGFTPGSDPVTINWVKADGSDELVETLSSQPLSGKVLWTSAAVNAEGFGVQWPGWEQLPDGKYVEVNNGLRPQMKFVLQMGESKTSVVDYPPGTPLCNPNPECPDIDSPECLSCDEKNITNSQFNLDGLAADQARLLNRSVRYYRQLTRKRKALQSIINQGDGLYIQNWNAVWSLPSVMQVLCTSETLCVSSDNSPTLLSYSDNAERFVKLARKVRNKIIRKGGNVRKARRFVKKQQRLVQKELEIHADIPVISQDCGDALS